MTSLPPADRTIPKLLARAANQHGQQVWLCHEKTEFRFAEMATKVMAWAEMLTTGGITRGSRVIVAMPNGPDGICSLLALMSTGVVALAVDPSASTEELQSLAVQTRAKLIIAEDPYPGHAHIEDDMLVLPEMHTRADRIEPSPESPALCVFSSGSTGAPKGVLLSQQALVLAAEATAFNLELRTGDVVATSNPFFHVNAIVYAMLASLCAGVPLTVYSRFSASGMSKRITRDQVSVLVLAAAAVPMWWEHLKNKPPFTSPLRRVLTGGAPPQICAGLTDKTGAYIHTGYALSECPLGLLAPPPSTGPPRPSPVIGQLPVHPGIQCKAGIFDAGGTPLPDGQEGEIWLHNPTAMLGYLDDPAATGAVLKGGWLITGDLGKRDTDGTFTYIARLKDMLRRKGEMFAPSDIEAVLRRHPMVSDAVVARFGAGPGTGEDRFAAFVELRSGAKPDVRELTEWCTANLPAHKCPDTLQLCSAFPRTGLGKPRKAELIELMKQTETLG